MSEAANVSTTVAGPAATCLTARTVRVGGKPVFVRGAGATTGPAIVFLHGLPTSSWLWRKVLPEVALLLPTWRLIAPDLPGYGYSAPRQRSGPRHLGGWLDALLHELAVPQFVLVGHDLGGLIALTTAVARRQRPVSTATEPRLVGLVLLDTTIYPAPALVLGLLPALVPPFAELSLHWQARGGTARTTTRRGTYIRGMQALLASETTLSQAEWAEYAIPYGDIAGWQQIPRSLRALARQAPFVLHCLQNLKHFTLPTHLIWGEHDPFFPLATARRLHRALGGTSAPVTVIHGAGHFPPEDQPVAVAMSLASFVQTRLAGAT